MSPIPLPYEDRREAGRILAQHLDEYAGRDDVVVLGLPRGGVPVAYEVARALQAPLDVFTVRKLGVPGQRELAMGAIASGGVKVLNDDVVRGFGVSPAAIEGVEREERAELERREQRYRGGRPARELRARCCIVIDDGVATGSTMRAGLRALRLLDPAGLVVAVPLASAQACRDLGGDADRVVCAATPEPFRAVGAWYRRFDQTSDDEVEHLLAAADEAAGQR